MVLILSRYSFTQVFYAVGGWSLIDGVDGDLLLPGIALVLCELLVDLLYRNGRVLSILVIRYEPIGRDLLDVYGIAG